MLKIRWLKVESKDRQITVIVANYGVSPAFNAFCRWIETNSKDEHEDDTSSHATAAAAAAAAGRGSASVVGESLSSSNFIQNVEEDTERTGDVCVGRGKQDDVIIFTTSLFTQLCTWCYLQKLQHQELTHLWSRDVTCIGFNIKNSHTCDLYNYKPRIIAPMSTCNNYQVSSILHLLSFLIRSVISWQSLIAESLAD